MGLAYWVEASHQRRELEAESELKDGYMSHRQCTISNILQNSILPLQNKDSKQVGVNHKSLAQYVSDPTHISIATYP